MSPDKNKNLTQAEFDFENVRLPRYNGPIELIFHLLRNDEIGVEHLPLSELAKAFSEHLESALADEDKNAKAADFLSSASRLLLVKSRALLPIENSGEEEEKDLDSINNDEDNEWNFALHLAEYHYVKEAASFLNKKNIDYINHYESNEFVKSSDAKKIPLDPKSDALATAFKSALEKILRREKRAYYDDRFTVREEEVRILAILQKLKKISFDEIFATCVAKDQIICAFLAILEIIKNNLCVITEIPNDYKTSYLLVFTSEDYKSGQAESETQ